jgi:SHS2 domain-containing protein
MFTIHHIPHTADICIRVVGDTPGELFRGGMDAMTRTMREDACQEEKPFPFRFSVDTASVDRTALLIDFLSEVLLLMQTEKAVFCKLDLIRLDEKEIDAKIHGYPVAGFDEDIKAVTYHEAEVVQRKDGKWETLIIFDI